MSVRLNYLIRSSGFPDSATSSIYAWAAYLTAMLPHLFPEWLLLFTGQALDFTELWAVLATEDYVGAHNWDSAQLVPSGRQSFSAPRCHRELSPMLES